MRRERRYLSPVFEVTVGDRRFRSINWSMGGILLDGRCHETTVGSRIEGSLAVPGSRDSLPFAAALVRTDPETGATALRFDNIGTEAVDFLDSAVAHRLH